jgi:hypothetical protein
LLDVSKIMTESFEMLLNRDKNLNQVMSKAQDLRASSRDLKKESRNLKLSFLLRQYMTPIIVVLLVLMFIFIKFYLF